MNALEATQAVSNQTLELGSNDDDLMHALVGVLSNILIKTNALSGNNQSTLVSTFGNRAPEIIAPAASTELKKAVCGQIVGPFSASSMSLSLLPACCVESYLPGTPEADGTQAAFLVPPSVGSGQSESDACPSFFMTGYALSPFPDAFIK